MSSLWVSAVRRNKKKDIFCHSMSGILVYIPRTCQPALQRYLSLWNGFTLCRQFFLLPQGGENTRRRILRHKLELFFFGFKSACNALCMEHFYCDFYLYLRATREKRKVYRRVNFQILWYVVKFSISINCREERCGFNPSFFFLSRANVFKVDSTILIYDKLCVY